MAKTHSVKQSKKATFAGNYTKCLISTVKILSKFHHENGEIHETNINTNALKIASECVCILEKGLSDLLNEGMPIDLKLEEEAIIIKTDNAENCYKILSAIHRMYQQKPFSVKDSVAASTESGNRGVHTTIFDSNDCPLQIRIQID